ncbi:Ig-like domain-containing protein [Deefgea sp. CFH1-16]|uniref:Ig-like domain-containing protein n=1 Tax=Deefgea sp. CFH1-16 TaxID=2675457 RepID=UPI001D8A201F|nr:Ig-like domain-containing protein [Deefgea sp. CFH1-16]MBM5573475.1 hypothetical protein [Deefgea sp. CFH1-16]
MYRVDVRGASGTGQTCTSNASGKYFNNGGKAAVVQITCTTAANITFDSPNAEVYLTTPAAKLLNFKVTRISDQQELQTNAVRYHSENPLIARVDAETGVVTAISVGSTRIVAKLPASYNGAEAAYQLSVKTPQNLRINRLEIGSSLLHVPNSVFQTLVPGRPALVRAYISSTQNATSTAQVTLHVQGGGKALIKPMTCPNTLPWNLDGAQIKPSYKLADTCYAWIDGPDVKAIMGNDLQVKVQVDGDLSAQVAPKVHQNGLMRVVVVPFRRDGVVPKVPTKAQIEEEIMTKMPFVQAEVTIREPFDVDSSVVGTSAALKIADSLRKQENPSSHYYGVISPPYGGGVIGMGYVGYPAAAGREGDPNAFHFTFSHEVGHNLNLNHASCGTSGGLDSFWKQFPEAWPGASNGVRSEAPIFDLRSGELIANNVWTADLMGYCSSGIWFSEYTYSKMSDYISRSSLFTLPKTLSANQKLAIKQKNFSEQSVDDFRYFICEWSR